MPKDDTYLSPFRRGVLEEIRRGRTLLDPQLHTDDRRQVLWAADFLFERGMIQVGFRITEQGLAALAPKPIPRREGNPTLNGRRRDKCFMCNKRTCHLRISLRDGSFDEVACDEHRADLLTFAESALNAHQKQTAHVEESEERLRRQRRSGC